MSISSDINATTSVSETNFSEIKQRSREKSVLVVRCLKRNHLDFVRRETEWNGDDKMGGGVDNRNERSLVRPNRVSCQPAM